MNTTEFKTICFGITRNWQTLNTYIILKCCRSNCPLSLSFIDLFIDQYIKWNLHIYDINFRTRKAIFKLVFDVQTNWILLFELKTLTNKYDDVKVFIVRLHRKLCKRLWDKTISTFSINELQLWVGRFYKNCENNRFYCKLLIYFLQLSCFIWSQCSRFTFCFL